METENITFNLTEEKSKMRKNNPKQEKEKKRKNRKHKMKWQALILTYQ